MKKVILTTLILLLIAYVMVDLAQAYTVTLIYRNTVGLMDENMALLEDGCIIQLIFTNDTTRDPPQPWNGRPSGDDVLWEYTSIGAGGVDPGSGQFIDSFDYDSANLGKYVYIRFFNASTWPQVTFYGMSPLHTLTDFFQLDIWDVTAGGLYLWTEYPFMIIPEPETWLTMLPALIFAIFIFRRKRKEKKTKTG
ncbi:MAG: hypothetical protein U9N73_08680 [Candidatus Auribacterota bacterium]|nr:hypothetical protein [Candidatus Auribacterota bacterium]